MSDGETFVELALSGRASLGDLDDFVDRWHESHGEEALHQYLGLTWEEYSLWVERPTSLRFVLFARRHEEPLRDVLEQFGAVESTEGDLVAARAEDREEAQAVLRWLIQTGRVKA